LGTYLIFRRREDLQMLKELPKEMEKGKRMIKTWQIWLIISLEETEFPSYDLKKFMNLSLCLFIAFY